MIHKGSIYIANIGIIVVGLLLANMPTLSGLDGNHTKKSMHDKKSKRDTKKPDNVLYTMESGRYVGNKVINRGLNGTSPTTVLTLRFKKLAGKSFPALNGLRFDGALVNLKWFESTGSDSQNITNLLYENNIYILPGTEKYLPCSKTGLGTESTTAIYVTGSSYAGSANISVNCSGDGRDVVIQLTCSEALQNQAAILYYDISSDNIDLIA